MQIELSKKEFRHLLDLVYIGNWILNSTRGDDRFQPYDDLESKLFSLCRSSGMQVLVEKWNGIDVPSKAYCDGGIHEAIAWELGKNHEISCVDLGVDFVTHGSIPQLHRQFGMDPASMARKVKEVLGNEN